MNIPEEPDFPPQINIVPMIDVIFAILTFFIISTLFLTRSEGLPVNLPEATSSETQRQAKLVVTIEEDGDILLNKTPTEISDLTAGIEALKGDATEALVTINADERVYHGIVVAVMDELRTLDNVRLGIATQRP